MKFRFTILAALAALACGLGQTKAAPLDAGPPLVNGLYVLNGACPGEGCTFDYFWRAKTKVALRERPAATARIVATVSPKELVRAVGAELYVVPWRGVVAGKGQGLQKGDVVHLLDYVGEGTYNLWRGGKILEGIAIDDVKIKWDRPLEARPESNWWVRLQRKNGQSGWDRGGAFECGSERAGDPDCVPVPKGQK